MVVAAGDAWRSHDGHLSNAARMQRKENLSLEPF
jgi:hypothetical protein